MTRQSESVLFDNILYRMYPFFFLSDCSRIKLIELNIDLSRIYFANTFGRYLFLWRKNIYLIWILHEKIICMLKILLKFENPLSFYRHLKKSSVLYGNKIILSKCKIKRVLTKSVNYFNKINHQKFT